MAAFGASFVTSAARQIAAKGTSVSLVPAGAPAYDDATLRVVTLPGTPIPTRALVNGGRTFAQGGELVRGDVVAVLAAKDLSAPQAGDRLLVGETSYRIVRVTPVSAGDFTVTYDLDGVIG